MARHVLNMERVVITPHVRSDGISAVDMGRLQTGIQAVEGAFNLPARIHASAFYTPDFLPPADQRRI
jgi:hypothetical protein